MHCEDTGCFEKAILGTVRILDVLLATVIILKLGTKEKAYHARLYDMRWNMAMSCCFPSLLIYSRAFFFRNKTFLLNAVFLRGGNRYDNRRPAAPSTGGRGTLYFVQVLSVVSRCSHSHRYFLFFTKWP